MTPNKFQDLASMMLGSSHQLIWEAFIKNNFSLVDMSEDFQAIIFYLEFESTNLRETGELDDETKIQLLISSLESKLK